MAADVAVAQVHPALRPLVARIEGYHIEGAPPGVHIGMPSRFLTLILALDEPLAVSWPPTTRGQRAPVIARAMISGLHAHPALIHHNGRQFGIQVGLTPTGARRLLGLPAAEIYEVSAHLDDVVGPAVRHLVDECAQRATWSARLDLLQRRLLELAGTSEGVAGPRPEVAWAWRRLSRCAGASSIAQLAHEVGWSTRHLGARFRAEYGLSPKTAARLMRFERSHRLIQRQVAQGALSLAAVAAECGFADQSHLDRDWVQFAGRSPTTWMREDGIAFVQDSGRAQAAR